LKKCLARFVHSVAQQRIVGVTAHEQHLETRALLAQAVRQIAAAHVRHDHIGGQEIDLPRAIVNQAKRFGSIAGGHHGEPVVAKTASQKMSNRLLVLDEENRLRTTRADVSRRRRSDRVCLVDEWKRDRKSRPFTLFTVHFDIPAALLHEAVHHGETESRPLADSLRREEGLEDSSFQFRRHTVSRVADHEAHIPAGRHRLSAHRHGCTQIDSLGSNRQPAGRKRIARVDGQVDENLSKVTRIDLHEPATGKERENASRRCVRDAARCPASAIARTSLRSGSSGGRRSRRIPQ